MILVIFESTLDYYLSFLGAIDYFYHFFVLEYFFINIVFGLINVLYRNNIIIFVADFLASTQVVLNLINVYNLTFFIFLLLFLSYLRFFSYSNFKSNIFYIVLLIPNRLAIFFLYCFSKQCF